MRIDDKVHLSIIRRYTCMANSYWNVP